MDISHQETNSSHETSFNKNLLLAKLHKFVAINGMVGFVKDTETERGPEWGGQHQTKVGMPKMQR